jgi:hypothetical protein
MGTTSTTASGAPLRVTGFTLMAEPIAAGVIGAGILRIERRLFCG